MPENWRAYPMRVYSYDVQCGGCGKWINEVAAPTPEAGAAGNGRCRDCVVKSPIIVSQAIDEEEAAGNTCPNCGALLTPAGLCPVCEGDGSEVESAESEVPEATESTVSVDPASEIPGTVEETAPESEGAGDEGKPAPPWEKGAQEAAAEARAAEEG